MAEYIDKFKEHLLQTQIVDPDGIHHEFVSGMHGQKIDFDLIPTGAPLYEEWVDVNIQFICGRYPKLPEAILGVANGTNRLAEHVAAGMPQYTEGLVSEKDPEDSKVLRLSTAVAEMVDILIPELVVVVEDVGTTGSNSVQVAVAALDAGAQNVEVVTSWKRRPTLERLEEAGIPYVAIIDESLTTYTKDECEESGFCAMGWEFIPRAH